MSNSLALKHISLTRSKRGITFKFASVTFSIDIVIALKDTEIAS